ncbi:MAG: hypothetical protein QOE54_6582 [Streptosporangiaceae bacterium]|jgi:hypothetical protein|nr:hypothetical protein [Streptosporangiaceae bacterium]MDX6434216.1 hypothetical protein [Streptosporangiaceae bacterium]
MTEDHQAPGTAAALAAALAGGIIATIIGVGQDYMFAHFLSHGWPATAIACLMIGVITGLPALLTRPGGAVVPLTAAVLAAASLLAGDIAYDLLSALSADRTPDPLGIVQGYAHQDLFYLALDLLAPLSAALVVAARVRRVRAAGRTRPDAGGWGPH